MSQYYADSEEVVNAANHKATDRLLTLLKVNHTSLLPSTVEIKDQSAEVEALQLLVQDLTTKNDDLRLLVCKQRALIENLSGDVAISKPHLSEIIAAVSEFYKVSRLKLVGEQRHRKVVLPRQVIYYLAREDGFSNRQIGHALGDRDHTSVIWGANKIAETIKTDEILRDDIDVLRVNLTEKVTQRQFGSNVVAFA